MPNYAPLKRELVFLLIALPQRKFVCLLIAPPKKNWFAPQLPPPPKKKKNWCIVPPLHLEILEVRTVPFNLIL